MQKIFILLSILNLTQGCRVVKNQSSGGTVVAREDHSSVVLIETFINFEVKYFCSGALISPNYVLTTARCVVGASFANLHIYAYKLFDVFEEGREIYKTTDFTFKENFERYINHNDIALVKLPVTLNLAVKQYKLAKLPTAPMLENSQGISVGWGVLDFYDEDEYATEFKNQIELTFAPESECRLAYPRLNWTEIGTAGRGCVVKKSGTNCISGHGSPFFIDDEVHAMQSFAYYGCEDEDVLTGIQLVHYHIDWIKSNSDYVEI